MKRGWFDAAVARMNVRAASLLVPHRDRGNWTAEWIGEIHHLCHVRPGEMSGEGQADPLEFSLGAYQDALWICCERMRADGLPAWRSGSPVRCGAGLGTAALAALIVCMTLPGARNALLRVPWRNTANLVLISSDGYAGTQSPSIAFADYEEWTTDTANLFTAIAFYRPAVKGVYVAHHETTHLAVAQASGNLLQVLGVQANRAMASGRDEESRLVLRRSAWRRLYQSDPQLVGRTADIDGRRVLIAGIVPDSAWRLPGSIDAVLLEDGASLAAMPAQTRGFVIARIRDSAFPAPRGGWRTMVESRYGVERKFDCISVTHLLGQPFFVFLFALLMASLALPATTALPLGDYPRRRDHLPLRVNAQRWAFLLVKFALVLAMVDLFSGGLAYGLFGSNAVTALYVQLATAFPALLFGFRWTLQDQRRRCPECLRVLSNPARVGQASCNFLSWNGTELFCMRGHGLLHIPEMPTSWFSTQRWLCLDSSWRSLFPESCAPSPEPV